MRSLPDGQKAALTYTFDDGTVDHYKVCAPMLEEYGFRGTFFVLPGLTAKKPQTIHLPSQLGDHKRMERPVMGWDQIRDLNKRGHEIGNHGWDHMRLWQVTDKRVLKRQIGRSAKVIGWETGTKPDSWCWPYYRPGATELGDALVAEHHKIVRRRHPQLSLGDTMSAKRAAGWVDKARHFGGWWIVVVHILGPDGSKQMHQVEEYILKASLKRAWELRKKVWVCTMRQLAPYLSRPLG